MADQMESTQGAEQDREASQEDQSLSCDQWAQVAQFIISEALTPEGVRIPEEDFKSCVSALGSYYDEESLNG